MHAALDAFATKGFHATTTRDISTAAGLSPAAIYVHFPSKMTVLQRICIDGHRSVWSTVESAACDAHEEPVDRLRCMLTALIDWHTTHRLLAHVIQREIRSLDDDALDEVAALRRESQRVMRARLRAAKSSLGLPLDGLDLEVIACWSLIIDVARWYHAKTESERRNFVARYAHLVMRMLGFDVQLPLPHKRLVS